LFKLFLRNILIQRFNNNYLIFIKYWRKKLIIKSPVLLKKHWNYALRILILGYNKNMNKQSEKCQICGCQLHRAKNTYARPNVEGRSHTSRHHYVPERFFGRSSNRKGTQREKIFKTCPWDHEGETATFCYD